MVVSRLLFITDPTRWSELSAALKESNSKSHTTEHKELCPYCATLCSADWVDVEVGFVQCGPYHCDECGASEIGPEKTTSLTEDEKKCGWYEPGSPPSPCANAINGTIIDHKLALALYRNGLKCLLDNHRK